MSSLKFHFGICKYLLISIQLSAQNPNSINKNAALLIFDALLFQLKFFLHFTTRITQGLQLF